MGNLRVHSRALVIGSGLAGGVAALCLADRGVPVTVLCASEDPENANSWLAQGGIIHRSGLPGDAESLIADILEAGRHHNNPGAVRHLAVHGPDALEAILHHRLGVPFDSAADGSAGGEARWDLAREGGHSSARIAHVADHTGKSIMECLSEALAAHPLVTLMPGYTAVDLLTSHHHTRGMTWRYELENRCCGAYVYEEATGTIKTHLADVVLLATGGVGQIYLHTANAASAVGSGIAMASRAGVRMENLEYVQFHPTTLYHIEPRRLLITEALRGEGALLLNAKGRRIMESVDPRLELAPRDVVSRAIMDELLATGEPCAFLDARATGVDLEERFPLIFRSCMDRGLDIRVQPIPVVPAAHYFCGGILTDLRGRTTLERLYAIGECACTGIHGANRLASTSLLEAVLWAVEAARDVSARIERGELSEDRAVHEAIGNWEHSGTERNDDPALIAQDWATIRNAMWNYVGIRRTTARLNRAFDELRDLSRTLNAFYKSTPLSKPLIDLFHGCQTACLITEAALRNKTSLGCHYREDPAPTP
ncbi:L-aspartate oxidase [Phaeovibrio sulfidiphilus]|uniref:L-aspartate oxidase n=1 Tax=Phaeovibrio sulfidiphilus TaxID=1220600 RepID=A0A8J6YNB5_9PROT|nr:L-aspartate oxidase [Phaeovibrio sulfidiphilus]MBE1237014.1 L-aspartate oxidase [Phaeovibrio sulfidiphilus]